MKKLLILFCFIFCFELTPLYAQEPAFPEIHITVSNSQFKKLLGSRGSKLELNNAVMLINGDSAKVKEMHSRGNNSLNYERKSLAVDLSNSITVHQNGKKIKLKHFDLLNLVMDHHLWHNRWAFLNMAALDVFPLYNSFCKLWINGKHHGIYMIVEKPPAYAREIGSPFTIRRGYGHKIDKEYTQTTSKDEAKQFRNQFHEIYASINAAHGDALFNSLSEKIELPQYFSWLAFNYLVMNGDYADELFMYIHPDTKRYNIIPWDYDDIIRPVPHEGWEQKNALSKNKLIFSSEESLDVAIVNDAVVYQKYLTHLDGLIQNLTDEDLTESANKVLKELKMLSTDPEVSAATPFLGKEPFDIKAAEENLLSTMSFMVMRRKSILGQMGK